MEYASDGESNRTEKNFGGAGDEFGKDGSADDTALMNHDALAAGFHNEDERAA